jgi:hypothetical protein
MLLVALLLLHNTPHSEAEEWRQGRASYYGAPTSFAAQFEASRGKNSFGSIAYGSCGFTNR